MFLGKALKLANWSLWIVLIILRNQMGYFWDCGKLGNHKIEFEI